VVALDYPDLDLASARFRVAQKTISSPERPAVELELRQDRSHLNAAYHLPGPDEPVEPDEYGASAPAWSGIVEAPYGLTRREDLVFAFLPVRAGQLCTDYLVYQQQRNGKYKEMSRGSRFAQRAHVVTAYPADTRLIDQTTRLELQFDSDDNTIDDLDLDDALSDTVLLFAGDEILSVFDAELLGVGHYRVSTVRGRFGTPRLTHAVDAPLYLMPRADLLLRDTTLKYLPVWRYVPGLQLNYAAFEDCPDVTSSYRWVALRPLAPANLKVNGDGHAPTYGSGEDIEVSWIVTDKRRCVVDPLQALDPEITTTVLEVRGLDDSLKATLSFGGSASPRTITNAQLVAALGGEISFRLRAWFERKHAFRSLAYDTITVTKI
jgi:hypothetical protein